MVKKTHFYENQTKNKQSDRFSSANLPLCKLQNVAVLEEITKQKT